MIFLPALLFGVLLLLLRRTDTIFSFFRRKGKGGKEEDQEERMFLLLGAAVLRRTKGAWRFYSCKRDRRSYSHLYVLKKKEKKVQETLDDFESLFFCLFCARPFFLSLFSQKSVVLRFLPAVFYPAFYRIS